MYFAYHIAYTMLVVGLAEMFLNTTGELNTLLSGLDMIGASCLLIDNLLKWMVYKHGTKT